MHSPRGARNYGISGTDFFSISAQLEQPVIPTGGDGPTSALAQHATAAIRGRYAPPTALTGCRSRKNLTPSLSPLWLVTTSS